MTHIGCPVCYLWSIYTLVLAFFDMDQESFDIFKISVLNRYNIELKDLYTELLSCKSNVVEWSNTIERGLVRLSHNLK